MKKLVILALMILVVGIILLLPRKKMISTVNAPATSETSVRNVDLKSESSDLDSTSVSSMDQDFNQLDSDTSTF